MKVYSKPNKNGQRQFLGWRASYEALVVKYDRLVARRQSEELHSKQIQLYQDSQRKVMELEGEVKRLKKMLKKYNVETK